MTATPASTSNVFSALSEAMAEAVSNASAFTVLVNARRRHPASGIAYSPDLVLTADHVVEREDNIKIMLPDSSEVSASLAGRDPGSDLALLRLNRAALSTAETAPNDGRVGQLVLALGRPSSEGIQASLGVISSVGGPIRTGRGSLLERYLTTDAIPYPGFSGGPLIDASGRVLGLNSSGLARGTSLTIPTSLAWSVADTLSKHGHVRRGYLGVRSQPVELPNAARSALGRQQATGLLLVGIEENSPASAGGLMIGDILVGLAGSPVSDPDDLVSRLSGSLVGTPTAVEILRGGQPVTINITIGERK